ncbi:MAG: DUF3429 domain-containing protein [Phenylobacterium sp.]
MTSGETAAGPSGIPGAVLAWGLAGLIPFLGLPALAFAAPALGAGSDRALALYAAVILSFLGGARWGRAVAEAAPDPRTIALAMAPSVAAWGLVLLPERHSGPALGGLAAALVLHLVWDLRSAGLPAWYPRLRLILTAGAVAGLAAGALG